jgi:type IV secretion system protein VirD4
MANHVKIRLGQEWDWQSGKLGEPVEVELESNLEIIAPPGAGKGATLEMVNLLAGLRGSCSVLSVDPSGQNAAVCAEARRTEAKNEVLCLNPFGLHVGLYPDLASVGCNPLANIDPNSDLFFQECQAVGDALIRIEGKDPHWTESARGLITGIIMWEVLKASRGED